MTLVSSAVTATAVEKRFTVDTGHPARVAKTMAVLGSVGLTVLLAVATVAAVELITRNSTSATITFLTTYAQPGWTTCGLFLLAFLGFDALIGRQHKAVLVLAPIAILLAFISEQKQIFLTDPLYPTDLLFGRQIMELMPALVRDRPWTAVAVGIGSLSAIAALVSVWIFAWKRFRPLTLKERALRLAIAVPLLAGFSSIMDYNQFSWVRDRLHVFPIMWDQAENYRHNGFMLAFAINLPMANVKAPAGYSGDAIDHIQQEPLPAGTNHRSKPDVIVVMSESLWDPTRLPSLKLSPDPMPVIRENTTGAVFSPEFGGLTANVEFEALTGFSNAFLPTGSIPYQQYVRNPIPSLATFFRGEGYTARAIHPFAGWFWNRTSVYKSFGFETFRTEETMPVMTKRGIFASDEALTNEIIRQADAQQDPFFFFAVTLQGHGPYEPNRYAKNTIKVEGDLPFADRQALSTYAQGVKEADDSLKTLMDWASNRDRETIIIVFGDHLPPLNTVYTATGYMNNVTASRRGSVEQMKQEHETPLIVWSNKTGVKEDIGTISPALLPYHILTEAGFEHPYYTGFLGRVQKQYDVIDRYQLIGDDGKATPDWSRKKNIDPLIRDYRLLQHDILFGKRRGLERFFPSHAGVVGAAS
ncbi:phosphoglycerol transferase MdoB-like AlkP superfamily enzyme [Mycoplana sp. BE70]|uniref:LTA synthase family protein n=1 Tax=Mycoplana sp. BE70 TaxID=2817775 RepID=UPI00285E55E9|nr:LTA synthase family protein [Mycoplana sp. BE70]MDR6759597.1 phosphoglycerol transferase MdoB-like AlkP superfamily enzyme [Mycoplana sp. BE70]